MSVQTLNGPHGATSRINWTLYGQVLQARPDYLAAQAVAPVIPAGASPSPGHRIEA